MAIFDHVVKLHFNTESTWSKAHVYEVYFVNPLQTMFGPYWTMFGLTSLTHQLKLWNFRKSTQSKTKVYAVYFLWPCQGCVWPCWHHVWPRYTSRPAKALVPYWLRSMDIQLYGIMAGCLDHVPCSFIFWLDGVPNISRMNQLSFLRYISLKVQVFWIMSAIFGSYWGHVLCFSC